MDPTEIDLNMEMEDGDNEASADERRPFFLATEALSFSRWKHET